MRRKHMPGCYCCGNCYVIPDEELPSITVSGWNFVGWGSIGGTEGGSCCRCAFFTPVDESYTESCSNVFATQEMNSEISWLMQGIRSNKPNVLCGPLDTLPEDTTEHQCFEIIDISSHTVTTAEKKSFKLLFRYKKDQLRVCLSKQTITCGDQDPVEKWVLLSEYSYNYYTYLTIGKEKSISSESSLLHECFQLREGLESCDDSCQETIDPPCTHEDMLESPNGYCLGAQGIASFQRVKFFDEIPTGEQTFTNLDTPEECSWDFCENPDGYVDQFCVSVSSWPTCIYSCRCEETYIDPIICERTYSITSTCPNCSLPPCNSTCMSWFITGSGLVPLNPCSAAIVCLPCTPVDCGTYTTYCICNPALPTCEGGSNVVLPPEDGGCTTWLSDYLSWAQTFSSMCGDYSGPRFNGGFETICYEAVGCDLENCDTECCWYYPCSIGDSNCGFCYTKFSWGSTSVTSYSISFSCDLTPVSACINAPTWTVIFE